MVGYDAWNIVPIHHNLLGAQLTSTERVFPPIANEALGAQSCSAHENVVIGGATIPMHKHAVEEVIVCLSGP
jgi:quercetin dioxygenase-like cupin family protein